MNIFADNLTYLRKQKKLTQEQVAQQLAEKVKTYQAWEEGRTKPSLSKMGKICRFFEFYDIYTLLHNKIKSRSVEETETPLQATRHGNHSSAH